MNWLLLAKIINGVIFLFSLYYLMKRRPGLLMPLLFAGMALNGFNFLLGTIWLPFKVVNIFIFLFVIFKLLPKNIDKKTYVAFSFVFFIALVNALFNLPDLGVKTGLLQGPLLRPIVQLYTYFSAFSLIIFMPYIIKNDYILLKIDKYYMRFSEFIVLIALVHFVFIKLGLSFMPILRGHGGHSEMARFGAGGVIMDRVYGFAGEPKHLGSMLLPYFFISFYKYLKGITNRSKLYHKLSLLITVFIIVQTYSSAVLIGLFVVLILGFILNFYSFKEPKIIRATLLLLLLMSLGTMLIDRGEGYHNISYVEFLEARTIGRVEDEIEERPETLVLEALIYESALPFMGFGPGMYVFAVKGLVFGSGISNINSGWVVILSDLGIPGVILYVFVLVKAIIDRKKILPKYRIIYSAYVLGFIAAGAGMLGNNQIIVFPLLLGFVISIKRISDKKIAEQEKSKNKII